MIGTENEAALALAGSLPKIGEGCARDVYLSNGIVYKVENGSEDSIDANLREFHNANRLIGKVPDPFIVPTVFLYQNNVLAMPHFTGTLMGECCNEPNCVYPDCMPWDIWEIANSIGADIPTYGNTMRLYSGHYVILDLENVA